MRAFLLISIAVLLNSCFFFSSRELNQINTVYDDFKKQEKHYLPLSARAYPLNPKKRMDYYTNLIFERYKENGNERNLLKIKLNLDPAQNLDSTVFIRFDNQLYKLSFKDIQSVIKHTSTTTQETKIIKEEKDKKEEKDAEKEIIIHTSSLVSSEIKPVKAVIELPDELISKLDKAGYFIVRFYIDDNAYTLRLKKKQVHKLNELFSL